MLSLQEARKQLHLEPFGDAIGREPTMPRRLPLRLRHALRNTLRIAHPTIRLIPMQPHISLPLRRLVLLLNSQRPRLRRSGE